MFYVKWADNIGARSRRLLRNTGEFARAKIFVRGVSTIKKQRIPASSRFCAPVAAQNDERRVEGEGNKGAS